MSLRESRTWNQEMHTTVSKRFGTSYHLAKRWLGGWHWITSTSSSMWKWVHMFEAVPGTANRCTQKPGHTYRELLFLICIARFSGATKCSAQHCLRQCPALLEAVPGTANRCTRKPGYTYRELVYLKSIGRVLGETKCSARHSVHFRCQVQHLVDQ